MSVQPRIVGWKRISDTLYGLYVMDENGTERLIYDSDGALYQGGTKVTSTAAALNALSAVLSSPVIDDGDAGVTLTSADQTNASATVTIPNIGDAADTFLMADTAQTATNKTLTTPVIASIYQDAGKTKLMTVPNTASDTLCAIAASQTLTNKTLTAPVMTDPAISFTQGTHDYGAGVVDWTLNAAELLLLYHKPSNASGAVNMIISHSIKRPYIVTNGTGQTLTVKGSTGSGFAINNGKTAIVMSDGTNVIALSAQSV